MKKLLFMVALIIGGALNSDAFAGHQQEIPMQIFNNGAASQGPTYAPPRPWYIVQDDYVLTLPALSDDYNFELRDESDEMAYTTFLPSGSTQIILPSTLSGSFEIRLVGDTYYYRGYVKL